MLADPERIGLVFANLLGNALKYTPAGGTVTLRGRPARGPGALSITDTGPGIPPEHRQAIFDKFFRVPGSAAIGAGLGLFIAKEIVAAHGGQIGVDSQPGEGSTVLVRAARRDRYDRHPPTRRAHRARG